MCGSRKKYEKPPFFSFWAKKADFGYFCQNGQNGEKYQKALGTLFLHLQALTKCKVSEKSNERFPRKRTYVCTKERTDAIPKVSTKVIKY